MPARKNWQTWFGADLLPEMVSCYLWIGVNLLCDLGRRIYFTMLISTWKYLIQFRVCQHIYLISIILDTLLCQYIIQYIISLKLSGKVKNPLWCFFFFFKLSKNRCKVNFRKEEITCINMEHLPLYLLPGFSLSEVSERMVFIYVCMHVPIYISVHTHWWTHMDEYVGKNVCLIQVPKPEHQYL